MKTEFVPVWIKQDRLPSWMTETESQKVLGVDRCLWGKMPAVNILKMGKNEDVTKMCHDMKLLFAASGDIRNVIKSIADLSDEYGGRCTLIINDVEFMVVARNIILLFVALRLRPDEAVPIMIHLWYSTLLPAVMIDTLKKVVLKPINEWCDKIKDQSPTSVQAKTFSFGKRSLRIVLEKQQWDDLKGYFSVPEGLTQSDAQDFRRCVMLAPENIDVLHRDLCCLPPPFRVAELTFREDGMLLPYGAPRDGFDTPNPTLFHEGQGWPMRDDARLIPGWDCEEIMKFPPKASNDVLGSLYLFLTKTLLRFCRRVKTLDVSFHLLNQDAQDLPRYFDARQLLFDRITVSSICDRTFLGFEKTLTTFSPYLKPKSSHPTAAILMLFRDTISEVYSRKDETARKLFVKSREVILKFFPSHLISAMLDASDKDWSRPDRIRFVQCKDMFGDCEAGFSVFQKEIKMNNLMSRCEMKIRKKNAIVDPWPFRVTERTTREEFERSRIPFPLGCERYAEFERAN